MPVDRRDFVKMSVAAGTVALGAHASTSASEAIKLDDPLYTQPYIDIDEQRATPEPHRYVHGGFTGSDLRFSMYFPPAEKYQGRFFHPVVPLSGTGNAFWRGGSVGFGFARGGGPSRLQFLVPAGAA